MRPAIILILLNALLACRTFRPIEIPAAAPAGMGGSRFYDSVISFTREQREALALREILAGDMPDFLRRFEKIRVSIKDSTGRKVKAEFFVSPDYLSLGSNKDWARIPLSPMAAQQIADAFHCFLPTRRMVDEIYRQARVKLQPVPMYAYRDSAVTFWHHHLIIEGQRKGRRGLIAGIKKDVVISGKITRDNKPDRVAIYGWHKLDGLPIQPLYTGHVNWYVDYSHGIRLVYEKIKINGKWMNYEAILKNPNWRGLLCDEEDCDFYRYPY